MWGVGLPTMAINGLRNKPIGPGGSTRRLHQIFLAFWGRTRIDEGVKDVSVARHGTIVIGPF
jgi:hypothetical protein